MREIIKSELVREHVKALQDACLGDEHAIDLAEASSETITEHILRVLAGDGVEPQEDNSLRALKEFFLREDDYVLRISQHIFANKLEAPVKIHPAFQGMVNGVSSDLKILEQPARDDSPVDGPVVAPEPFGKKQLAEEEADRALRIVPMKHVAKSAAAQLLVAAPDWCNEFSKLLVIATAESRNHIRDLSEGIFQTDQELMNFTLVPTRYVLEMVKSLSCGSQRVTADDYQPLLALLEGRTRDIALAEGLYIGQERILFWEGLFNFTPQAKAENLDRWVENISAKPTSSTTPKAFPEHAAAKPQNAADPTTVSSGSPGTELVDLVGVQRGRLAPTFTLFSKKP